jgi:RND family efflux transporter MFP subunit
MESPEASMSSDEPKPVLDTGNPAASEPAPEGKKPEAIRRGLGCGWASLLIVFFIAAAGEAVYILRDRIFRPAESSSSPAPTARKVLYWQDPMHPQYKSDKPGTAPDCGMDLVPIYEKAAGVGTAAPAERKILYYTCSMHPRVKSDKPGPCPDCGMNLTPVYGESPPAKPASTSQRGILYWQDPMNPERRSDKPGKAADGMDLVPVYAEEPSQNRPEGAFKITAEKQQLIGVQYGQVTSRPLAKTTRAVARLAYDETKITRVHSKIAGWIERVFVDFTGDLVKKGQPLLTVYSPELVATQDEYILALKARDNLGRSAFTDVAAGANSLLDAARRRLELWDVAESQIAELEKTRKPAKAVTLYSTADGFVIARNAFERQRIMPETELYSIADLSTIWAIADVYEYEAPLVKLGQAAAMTLPSFTGRTFRGKITYVYPQLDNATRTIKVRVEFSNPDYSLKPDMYANVELRFEFGSRLSIPKEAVLDSGSEQMVFVALDEGYFEPRKVQLGDEAGGEVIVMSGLKAGERVVTSGNFLVDSESKLKSALSGMAMPGMDHGGGTAKKAEQKVGQPASPQAQPMDHSAHKPAGESPKPAKQEDHSQHQKSSSAPKKEAPMDHSEHQMKPEQDAHD